MPYGPTGTSMVPILHELIAAQSPVNLEAKSSSDRHLRFLPRTAVNPGADLVPSGGEAGRIKSVAAPDQQDSPTDAVIAPADADQQTNADAPPKWFAEFVAKSDARHKTLVEDVARLRKRAKATATDEPEGDAESAKPKGTDTLASIRFGRTLASLPEDAQADLESMLEEGEPLDVVAKIAESLKKHSAKPESGKVTDKPRAHGGTAAASRAGVHHPTSVSAYKALPKDQQDKLMSDPSFEFSRLSRK